MSRRSAGTQVPLERALIACRLRYRSPERDLRDFEDGATLRVLCLAWSLGGVRNMKIGSQQVPMPKPGYLHLTKGQPVQWRRIGAADSLGKYGLWVLGVINRVRGDSERVSLPKRGDRFLHEGEEKTWHASGGMEAVTIPLGSGLETSDRALAGSRRAAFAVVTPDGRHDIAIPKLDIALVRHVFSA